jgi:hypothetical protein
MRLRWQGSGRGQVRPAERAFLAVPPSDLSRFRSSKMQFHEYTTLRNHWAGQNHDPKFKSLALKNGSGEFRAIFLRGVPKLLARSGLSAYHRTQFERQLRIAATEQQWVDLNRPYYNFWPIAVSLASNVKLDVPFSKLALPFNSLLLRFPLGHEPYTVGTAMLVWFRVEKFFGVDCWFAKSADCFSVQFMKYEPDQTVEHWLGSVKTEKFGHDWLNKERADQFDHQAASRLMVRLAVFACLLANSEDMITPVVLAKDRAKYEATSDVEARQWLEQRARRLAGTGFDVGKEMQAEKDKSPHWRNPHLCLFWTGEGRTRPIIQVRSGSVVQRVSMADVPTGYLGAETAAEDVLPDPKTPREAISKSRRFDIMKRDGFRCRLCGGTQEHGLVLHVDHKVPLAKGGSNEDDNLWTLCEYCNLGKSDKDLT